MFFFFFFFRNYCHSFIPKRREWTSLTTTTQPTPPPTIFTTTCRYTSLSTPHLTMYIVCTISHLHEIEVLLFHLTIGCLKANNKWFSSLRLALSCSYKYQTDISCISCRQSQSSLHFTRLCDLHESHRLYK